MPGVMWLERENHSRDWASMLEKTERWRLSTGAFRTFPGRPLWA